MLLIMLPFAVMAAVAVSRLLVGPGAGLLPLLALGPALAAIAGGLALALAVGATALVLSVLLIPFQPASTPTHHSVVAIVAVVGVTVVSVIANSARQRRERELSDVQAVADVAQQVLLRPLPARVDSVSLAVRYNSAATRARIGGDLYDAAITPWGLRVIIGDVQGKGLTSVRTASVVLGAFREAAHDEVDLSGLASRIEASLARRGADERFVTAVLAQIPPGGAKVEVLNRGHPQPLLVGAGGATFVGPEEGSLPLGLSGLADLPRARTKIAFHPGDRLLFYTDGVSEARDAAGRFFPLARSLSLHADADPEALLARVTADIRRHTGHMPDDDEAMLLIRRDPASH